MDQIKINQPELVTRPDLSDILETYGDDYENVTWGICGGLIGVLITICLFLFLRKRNC